ncbi:hypothetical protein ES703_76526 [subsurface metagenome]
MIWSIKDKATVRIARGYSSSGISLDDKARRGITASKGIRMRRTELLFAELTSSAPNTASRGNNRKKRTRGIIEKLN